MKLDRSFPFGTVSGHPRAKFEQGGILFDAEGRQLGPEKKVLSPAEMIIETDQVSSAKEFLLQILKGGPLSKAVIFKEAEANNQPWEHVKTAQTLIGITSYKHGGSETWKLSNVA